MNRTKLLIIGLAAASCAQYAGADTLMPERSAGVLGCVGPSPQSCSQQVVGSSINTTLPAGTGTAAMSGSAQSEYGILNSSSAEVFSGSSTPVFSYVNASANFQDIITVSFAPFTGSTGILFIGFTLDGTNSRSGSLEAESYVNVGLADATSGVTRETDELNFTSSSTSGTFFFPQTFTFIYGQPFALYFNLGTVAGTFDPYIGASIIPRTATASGTASADFSNTFVLSALNVVDSQGNPVNGVTFASLSGTQYSSNGVNGAVPEPSSWVLLLSGLVGLRALCQLNKTQRRTTQGF